MSKVIDLTGLSRAITKIKEWVNGILDWNAQEGQDGHIKNRTHYDRSQSIELKDVECDGEIQLVGTNEYFGEIIERATKITVDYSYTEYGDSDPENIYEESYSGYKEIQVTVGQHTENLSTLQLDIDTVKDAEIGEGNVITLMWIFVAMPIKDGYFKITVECEPKQLDEKYIPNTIARQSEITRVENRIAELENIIEQITIKVEE